MKVGSRPKRVRRPFPYLSIRSSRTKRALLRAGAQYANPVRIYRGLTPFPNTKIVRHKYVDNIQFPAITSAVGYGKYTFRANSVYDPDFSGVGHQPMFHDEMAAQYTHYTVLSSYIRITIAAENAQKRNWSIWCDDDSTVPTNANTAFEQHRYISAIKADKRNAPLKLTCRYNAARWNKTTLSGLMSDNSKKTAVNNNPVAGETKFFHLYCAPSNVAENLDSIEGVNFEMFFIVSWREPVDHVGS